MEGETNSNSKNCPANTSTDQELPPANEDIMQTAHVRVFKPGVAGPQYEAMLLNQLTEIKQGQDTRRMLTQMLEDKKQQKGAKGKNTTNNHGGPAGDEEEEADKMMEQLMDATRDYREGGGSMLKRKSKNLVAVAAAWKHSMLRSSKVSAQNKETFAKYGDEDLCSVHMQCANAKLVTGSADSDKDVRED